MLDIYYKGFNTMNHYYIAHYKSLYFHVEIKNGKGNTKLDIKEVGEISINNLYKLKYEDRKHIFEFVKEHLKPFIRTKKLSKLLDEN